MKGSLSMASSMDRSDVIQTSLMLTVEGQDWTQPCYYISGGLLPVHPKEPEIQERIDQNKMPLKNFLFSLKFKF